MPLGTPTMVLPQSGYRAWNNAFEMRKGHWQGQAGRQVLHFTLLLQRASPNKGYGLGCEHAWYPADNSPRCSGELVLGTHFVQAEASFQNRGSCTEACCHQFHQWRGLLSSAPGEAQAVTPLLASVLFTLSIPPAAGGEGIRGKKAVGDGAACLVWVSWNMWLPLEPCHVISFPEMSQHS